MNVGIIYGVIGGLVVFVLVFFKKPFKCIKCDEILPRIRIPKSLNEFLWGHQTCPKCKTRYDRKGLIIP